MKQALFWIWTGAATLLLSGCMTGPLQENPVLLRPGAQPCTNPVFIPPGPDSYGVVWEKVLNIVTDYGFEIAYANRYDGRIETIPAIAPGIEQPWKPGSPDFYQRVLATFQSYRHRVLVNIKPASDGGFFIEVQVLKELEDVARPTKSTAGSVLFVGPTPVERQFEVIEANIYESTWIPHGRDPKIEQVLLDRIARIQCSDPRPPVAPINAPKP